MPLYEITCQNTINSNGIRMEKGTKFIVTTPFATNPLRSGPGNLDLAMSCCKSQTGVDFTSSPFLLRGVSFNVVRKA